jgi:hypothetical protein
MSLYDRISDLPVRVDSVEFETREREIAGGHTRTTTVVIIHGEDETGYGEDVTYESEDHYALADSSVATDLAPMGEYAYQEWSHALDGIDLFPDHGPSRETFRRYRRWAFESAALDLALKQAETTLADAFDREYDPVRFLASTRLPDPPTVDRIRTYLEVNPDLEFKLDPTANWTPDLVDELAAMDIVRIADLKGQYEESEVKQPANPDLYRLVIKRFPDALIEDPKLTEETRPLFDGHEHRVTWDFPITGVESIEELPFQPEWLNIKPSRFGSVESLFDSIEYCVERGIGMYGGGQTELSVGREHIHALASLFYPGGPNDIAPRGYNDPEPSPGLPTSPLSPPSAPRGLEWR